MMHTPAVIAALLLVSFLHGDVSAKSTGPYLSVRDHNKDKNASKWPTRTVYLTPDAQNTPLDAAVAHLRPPPPRVPPIFDIFVGISAFRDGWRCGQTLLTAFARADHPDRVRFGVVDQVHASDETCIDSYCKMAMEKWTNDTRCRHRDQIKIDQRAADESRGPTLARHFQQRLVGDEEFCLQVDAHSAFTRHWDSSLVVDWTAADNEMAILTTYIHNIANHINADGTNKLASQSTHLCQTKRGGSNNVRNVGADLLFHSKRPQMQALWGAGFSFGKCHAEKRVPVDSHTLWMFDGEEFQRSSHLWTYGYDLYSPTPHGMMVYHNYTAVPAKFYQLSAATSAARGIEQERANNRVKFMLHIPFQGQVDAEELDVYGYGPVRSIDQYLDFAGVTFAPNQVDTQSCHQLHWVPYANPEAVETLLPGWKMLPVATEPAAIVAHFLRQDVVQNDPVFVDGRKPSNQGSRGVAGVAGFVVVAGLVGGIFYATQDRARPSQHT
ncbi:Aste57867_21325 [Aphanomyces stellatus]|uniref:Aste57867_21325 protein n=1 Tax=Aphanomyces stellatus TaxID=120398 RepID=A0A485LII0_9STRA|nr:hypothetical protein As57867_021256 [Aphanomyces stellatus]VFT97997.1 Aste57867_21325 [Aphanomyces stellatus]